jgi:hypothetical protein
MRLKLDNERSMSFDPQRHPHLDHGYAVASYSSQGKPQTVCSLIIDTELGAKDLLNNRMAYVSVSRGATGAAYATEKSDSSHRVPGRISFSHMEIHRLPGLRMNKKRRHGPGQDIRFGV